MGTVGGKESTPSIAVKLGLMHFQNHQDGDYEDNHVNDDDDGDDKDKDEARQDKLGKSGQMLSDLTRSSGKLS